MSQLLALLLAAALQPPEAGAQWIELGSNDERAAHVDRASVEREGGIASFWLRLRFERPRDGWRTLYTRIDIDCAARTIRPRRVVAHRADGSLHRAEDLSAVDYPFAPVPPDSNGEAMVSVLCSTPI